MVKRGPFGLGALSVAFAALCVASGFGGEGADAVEARARALAARLATGDEAARDEAARQLIALGPEALPVLKQAAKDPNAERARRAQHLVVLWERFGALREEVVERTGRVDAAAAALLAAGPLAFDVLVAAYGTGPDVSRPFLVCEKIIELLPKLDPGRALDFYEKVVLPGSHAPMRSRACFAIAKVRQERSARLLVSALVHRDANTRLQAEGALGELHDLAIGPLLELLEAKEPGHRAAAATALHRLGDHWRGVPRDARIVPALLRAQGDPDPQVRAAATRALARYPGGHFDRSFAHKDPAVREAAARYAGGMRLRGCKDRYLGALGDRSPAVRAAAARGLRHEKGADVVEALLAALGDPSPEVRKGAIEALCRRRTGLPTDRLLAMVNAADQPEEARAIAITLLCRAAGAAHLDLIIALGEDGRQPESVQRAAIAGAMEIDDPRLVPFARRVVADRRLRPMVEQRHVFVGQPGSLAVLRLVESGGAAEADFIVAQCIDNELNPWECARLDRLGKAALPALRRAMAEGPDPARLAALSALGRLDALAVVAAALSDKSARVRRAAALTLAQRGHKQAIPAIAKLLDDEDPEVKGTAATALVLLGDNRAKAQAVAYHGARFRGFDYHSALFLLHHALSTGMTKDQVAAILGHPPGTTGKAHRWFYSCTGGMCVEVEFRDGKLVKVFPGPDEGAEGGVP